MKTLLKSIVFLAVLSMSMSALAQQGEQGGFSAQNFQTAPGYGSFLTVEGAQADQERGFGLRLGGMAIYQHKPLMIRGCNEFEGEDCVDWSDESTAIVKHHLMLEALAAMSFGGVFEAGVAIPVILYQTGDDAAREGTTVESPSNAAGLDDIRLHLKLDILHGLFNVKNKNIGLALVPVVSFPVGNAISSSSFSGDSSVTFHPKLAFGAGGDKVRFGLNAGYLLREKKEFWGAQMGGRFSYGAAVEVGFTDRMSGIMEAFGQSAFSSDLTETPLEADAALRYAFDNGLTATAGAGAGILAGVGTPMVRGLLGVMWSPPLEEAELDTDGDGLLDKDDECPKDPEDKDQFEDENGCPDPDNDQDGVADTNDECPNDPEDMDQFEDENGCPDLDNDQDGLADTNDECPNDPEDMDQFEDENGCPDPDNDKDGILDVSDKCPNEPETVNEHEDSDGCPDEAPKLIVVKDDKIELLEKVHFATNSDKIVGDQSFEILDEVVTVLNSHDTMNVRIEGHTDSRGRAKHNKKLSKRRAASVKRYLVEKGIDEGRLESQGFGPDNPIDTNKTKAGRAANRRVEFHITNN